MREGLSATRENSTAAKNALQATSSRTTSRRKAINADSREAGQSVTGRGRGLPTRHGEDGDEPQGPGEFIHAVRGRCIQSVQRGGNACWWSWTAGELRCTSRAPGIAGLGNIYSS